MKITIIGAGIGGLTAAIALQQKGFEVEIFETSKAFKKAGSGINLAANAMQIYKRLGVYEAIVNAGSYTNVMLVTDQNLKTISKINLVEAEKIYNVKTIAIHRATLHEILLDKLIDVPIFLDKKLKTVVQQNKQVDLSFEDGSTHTASLVIGADGIHSVVRKSIVKNTNLRIAKQVCWRGIVKIDTPEKYKTELNELWGRGKRFGFVHITKEEVYWYALANYKNNYKTEFENLKLDEFYSDFHPLVQKIIATTLKNDIILNEMMDLKPISTWYAKNVCLIGDAAHATTPNMGQGACQAIESAFVLAKCLSDEKTIALAFKRLEKIRKITAKKVVKTSWLVGKMAHLENSFGIQLRNQLIKLMPQKIIQKQSYALFKLDYLVNKE